MPILPIHFHWQVGIINTIFECEFYFHREKIISKCLLKKSCCLLFFSLMPTDISSCQILDFAPDSKSLTERTFTGTSHTRRYNLAFIACFASDRQTFTVCLRSDMSWVHYSWYLSNILKQVFNFLRSWVRELLSRDVFHNCSTNRLALLNQYYVG